MDRQQIMEMEPELDSDIAEKVMGWVIENPRSGKAYWRLDRGDLVTNEYMRETSWSPYASAADDYEVLEHVRQNWTSEQQESMAIILQQQWLKCVPLLAMSLAPLAYRIGDYSRGALLTLAPESPKAGG